MVYHKRDIRVDEYSCPMKDARKLSSFEEIEDEEEVMEEIERIKKITSEEIEEFKNWEASIQPRKKGDNKFADAEHMHLTPNVSPKTTITLWPGHDGKMIEAFWEGSLHDTENGGGELSMAVRSKAQDPEVMARRMPGRNVGYTKNGIKPKCPVCGVTVSDFGMCPVCLRTVTKRFNANGTPVVVFNDKGPVYDRYVKPEIIDIYVKRKNGDKITKEYVSIRELNTTWLKNEEIGKFNFSGSVNKKSDGRSPRGEIPDAKDPDRMHKFRHTPAFKLDFQVKTIYNEGKPRYAFNDIPVVRVKKDLNECPECGCKVKLNEMRRGDKLCPKCGLVLGRVVIHLDAMEGDLDD